MLYRTQISQGKGALEFTTLTFIMSSL